MNYVLVLQGFLGCSCVLNRFNTKVLKRRVLLKNDITSSTILIASKVRIQSGLWLFEESAKNISCIISVFGLNFACSGNLCFYALREAGKNHMVIIYLKGNLI